MSVGVTRRRWRSRLTSFLLFVGGVALLHLISNLTGFGDWLNGTPAAVAVVRTIGVLFFGLSAFVLLFLRDQADGPRRLRDWIYAALAIAMTLLNAALLIGGEDTI